MPHHSLICSLSNAWPTANTCGHAHCPSVAQHNSAAAPLTRTSAAADQRDASTLSCCQGNNRAAHPVLQLHKRLATPPRSCCCNMCSHSNTEGQLLKPATIVYDSHSLWAGQRATIDSASSTWHKHSLQATPDALSNPALLRRAQTVIMHLCYWSKAEAQKETQHAQASCFHTSWRASPVHMRACEHALHCTEPSSQPAQGHDSKATKNPFNKSASPGCNTPIHPIHQHYNTPT